jgi:hypothetical protein
VTGVTLGVSEVSLENGGAADAQAAQGGRDEGEGASVSDGTDSSLDGSDSESGSDVGSEGEDDYEGVEYECEGFEGDRMPLGGCPECLLEGRTTGCDHQIQRQGGTGCAQGEQQHQESNVSSITADFAMQNVLLQVRVCFSSTVLRYWSVLS